MTAYLANIALLFAEGAILLWQQPSDFKKKVFCALASLQWIALSGLRHYSVGADTLAYKVHGFDTVLYTSWSELMGAMWSVYSGAGGPKDPGYNLVVKAFQVFSQNYQMYLLFVAVVFTVPLGIFIYKYSRDPFMSFLIYSCLFSAFFAITGIRQTVATALVVLIGYHFIEQRRLVPFLVLSAVAFTIHKSSFVFVLLYFLAPMRLTRKRVIAVVAASVVVYMFRVPVTSLLASATGYEWYAQGYEGAGTWVFTAMMLLVLGVAAWKMPTILRAEPRAQSWFNAVLIGVLLIPLTFVDPSNMRAVQYFSFFLVLLVPEAIGAFKKKRERMLVAYTATSVLILLFMRGNPQYLFFWQGV